MNVQGQQASLPRTTSRTVALIEEGIIAGVIGAVVVAIFFLVLDFMRGHPFYTPTLLGSALFLGKSVEAVTSVSATMVFAYTGLHVLLFMLAGVTLSWMVSQFVRNPQFGMVLLLIFLLFEAVLFGFEVAVMPSLVGALGTWAVGVANLLSAVVMFWFLLHRHPEATERLRQGWSQ